MLSFVMWVMGYTLRKARRLAREAEKQKKMKEAGAWRSCPRCLALLIDNRLTLKCPRCGYSRRSNLS